jgi:hypothetical protein
MKTIPLTTGEIAFVDDEDYERVSLFDWYALRVTENLVYAVRVIPAARGKQTLEFMHRYIMNAAKGEIIDHRDGNGLNNSRTMNLRRCSHAENMRNSKVHRNNTSGYRGVSRSKHGFRAYLSVNGKTIHAGYFKSPIDAARKYDAKAREQFGEFARLNFSVNT